MSCLVDVTGFVFGVHNLLAPVQTKVSGEHIAESDSQKKIWHAVITEQFTTLYSEVKIIMTMLGSVKRSSFAYVK